MAKKQWGYVMGIFEVDDKGPYGTGKGYYSNEVLGISPYKLVAGPYAEFMKSEDYDQVKNPLQIGDFIRWIGDKNTLSVKLSRDAKMIDEFRRLYKDNINYGIVALVVVPMDAMPEGTANRIVWMENHYTEAVILRNVSLQFVWSVTHIDVEASGKYSSYIYDYITFVAEKVDFHFS